MNFVKHLCFMNLFLFVFSCGTFSAFSADALIEEVELEPSKSTDIILTVNNGRVDKKYTHAMLESLGLKRIRTSTYWPEDDGVYEGVLMLDLLNHSGIEKGKSVRVTALDDYQIEIPYEDFTKWPVLLATRRDGKPMSIRKKGPTRIIYPKDIGGEIARSDMRSRWIWAIKTISTNIQ